MGKKILILERIILLPEREDKAFSASIVRLHNKRIDAKKKDRSRFFRREAVVLENLDNNKRIVRMVLGAAGTKRLTMNALAIDYDGIDALGFNQEVLKGQPVRIAIRRANDWDLIRYYWNHPDIGYRTAHRIAAVSFGMGTIGLLLGLLPLFL